jgi:UDP-N-acetylmuramyl pentapeptide synthase
VLRVASTTEAAAQLRDLARPGDAVLVKGSRAATMEDVIRAFAKQSAGRSQP